MIKDNKVIECASSPFKTNTYKVRSYTHAWIDDNTLVVMAANGDASKVIWSKLNTDNMSILAEGTLDILLPESEVTGEETKKFTTSGILTYNEKTGKLFYFYYGKNGLSGKSGKTTTAFYTAVLDPVTLAVESNKRNSLAREMAGSAYGELMQDCVMYDEAVTSTSPQSPKRAIWNKDTCCVSTMVKSISTPLTKDIRMQTVNCSPSSIWETAKL